MPSDEAADDRAMRVVRIIANLAVAEIAATQGFYSDYLGLDRQELGLDWVTRYVAPTGVSLQVLTHDAGGPVNPVLSVAVEDVDAAHEEAVRRGFEIVHPPPTESWGVRRVSSATLMVTS